MYLVDTNVFLEILLGQDKNEACKNFLKDNQALISLSDFTLHSIGVITFQLKKEGAFLKFLNDVLPVFELKTLKQEVYEDIVHIKDLYGLDFDDSYQVAIAKENDLQIVTLDTDFKKVSHKLKVVFL